MAIVSPEQFCTINKANSQVLLASVSPALIPNNNGYCTLNGFWRNIGVVVILNEGDSCVNLGMIVSQVTYEVFLYNSADRDNATVTGISYQDGTQGIATDLTLGTVIPAQTSISFNVIGEINGPASIDESIYIQLNTGQILSICITGKRGSLLSFDYFDLEDYQLSFKYDQNVYYGQDKRGQSIGFEIDPKLQLRFTAPVSPKTLDFYLRMARDFQGRVILPLFNYSIATGGASAGSNTITVTGTMPHEIDAGDFIVLGSDAFEIAAVTSSYPFETATITLTTPLTADIAPSSCVHFAKLFSVMELNGKIINPDLALMRFRAISENTFFNRVNDIPNLETLDNKPILNSLPVNAAKSIPVRFQMNADVDMLNGGQVYKTAYAEAKRSLDLELYLKSWAEYQMFLKFMATVRGEYDICVYFSEEYTGLALDATAGDTTIKLTTDAFERYDITDKPFLLLKSAGNKEYVKIYNIQANNIIELQQPLVNSYSVGETKVFTGEFMRPVNKEFSIKPVGEGVYRTKITVEGATDVF